MSRDSSRDSLDTVKGIHGILDSIELKQVIHLRYVCMRVRARACVRARVCV